MKNNLKGSFVIQFPARTAWGFVFEKSSSMRHATINITMNITMDIYTHAVSSKKWRAQSKVLEVVEMILPAEKAIRVSAGVANAGVCWDAGQTGFRVRR